MVKKRLLKFAILGLMTVFMLSFCGCSWESCENPKLEDVIPTEFGEPEGLWLYKDNFRMRTDGTEAETVLKEITVDGERYTEEDFTVWRMGYVTATHEIFYIVEVEPEECEFRQYVWHFNYETKEDGLLYTPPDDTGCYLQISDSYVYVSAGSAAGALFDLNARFVADGLLWFTLSGDTLYKAQDGELTFWRDGEEHVFPASFEYKYSSLTHCGNYLYYTDGINFMAVSLETAEAKTTSVGENKKYIDYAVGDRFYLITDNYTFSIKFWVADGLDIKLTYIFVPDEITDKEVEELMVRGDGYNSEFISLKCISSRREHGSYLYNDRNYYFDIAKGEMVNDTKYIHAKEEIKYTVVGEYKFYVDKRGYGNGDWFGYADYCYCLMRECNGEREVMQYNLDGERFFDDICDF